MPPGVAFQRRDGAAGIEAALYPAGESVSLLLCFALLGLRHPALCSAIYGFRAYFAGAIRN